MIISGYFLVKFPSKSRAVLEQQSRVSGLKNPIYIEESEINVIIYLLPFCKTLKRKPGTSEA